MQTFPYLSREFLKNRHRLSHQQINTLLKEKYPREHLDEKYEQLLLVGEFIKLTDGLREATIPFIPLKGPLLSYRLHNDASYRYSHDLDFLVPPDAVKQAISILETNGYRPYYFPWPENSKKERRFMRFSNQIMFGHPEKEIYIEIHWKLFKPKITNSGVLSAVLKSNLSEVTFKHRPFSVLSNELELLYLVIHGGLHSWARLKWLLDIKDFIEKIPFNEKKFAQLAAKLNADRMILLANDVLSLYFPECPLLPCTTVSKTKTRLNFTRTQIEAGEDHHLSFPEKAKVYWFQLNCFPGYGYKLSTLGVIIYHKYLNIALIRPFIKRNEENWAPIPSLSNEQ